jgi:vacuolar-type H+-ATPase subunit I/STV1
MKKKKVLKKVEKHIKGDIKNFKKEAQEDRELLKKIKPKKKVAKKKSVAKKKISKVMKEFKSGKLHSGSKKGPIVTNPKQALAISFSEAREAGAKIPKKKK